MIPKLRPIDIRPIVQDGRPALLLRDPLQLADQVLVIPRELGPALALCDGTRDISALHAALLVRFGLRVDLTLLRQFISALDDACLLENSRFLDARERALREYRAAPHRSLASAGVSYPAQADDLARLLDRLMESAPLPGEETEGQIRGIVSPHIDFARGGRVYAAVWGRARSQLGRAELVVILGTDHFGADGSITLTRQNYATPFGVLPTAQDAVSLLAGAVGEENAFADEIHHRAEHSIELAAIWLHHARRGEPCEVLPVLCGSLVFGNGAGDLDPRTRFLDAAKALREILADRGAVVVAAGDLAHVGPAFGGLPVSDATRARVLRADQELMARIAAGDAPGLAQQIGQGGDPNNVCGAPPFYLALQALGSASGEVVAYEQCPADETDTSFVSICGILLH